MIKKIIGLAVLILIVASSGFFYWQNQKDARELNKTLPEGVRVKKSLFGQEYKVVNKIDGYEFKVPKAWEGLSTIDYVPEREEFGYSFDSIGLTGREGEGRIAGVGYFKQKSPTVDLMKWAEDLIKLSKPSANIDNDKIGNIEVVKTLDRLDVITGYAYFFKNNSGIYVITGGSEEFIREIILNGKW